MVDIKKNCPANSFEGRISQNQDFEEYHYAKQYYKKVNFNYDNDFKVQSIDDFFTSLQIISNAILLKKLNLRSKVSGCAYYKLYIEKIISEEVFIMMEQIRVERNIVHYQGHLALYFNENKVKNIVEVAKECYDLLLKIYED